MQKQGMGWKVEQHPGEWQRKGESISFIVPSLWEMPDISAETVP